ncbi:MAG: methyltransferase domain-containing protein [Acidobacteria bacterium]|nr:methyltransferase domain-containing protein [Acidobacteriota bacterium]
MREREEWERVASSWQDFSAARSTLYYRRREIALIERWLGPMAGKKVLKLDLWNEAFNTRILHWMAEQGAEIVALDGSGVVTARARANTLAKGVRCRLLRADIRDLPLADASFDLAYTMGTIEHVAEYRQALAELRRVLRPGGRAIVGVPHRWNLFCRPLLVSVLSAFGAYPYAPEKSFGAAELRRDLRGAGFRVLDRGGLLVAPGPLRMLDVVLHTRGSGLARLTGALAAPFEALETRWQWAGRFGYLLAMQVERAD